MSKRYAPRTAAGRKVQLQLEYLSLAPEETILADVLAIEDEMDRELNVELCRQHDERIRRLESALLHIFDISADRPATRSAARAALTEEPVVP